MGQAVLYGDVAAFRAEGLGRAEAPFKEAYVLLENVENARKCAAILKGMLQKSEPFLEADIAILEDLGARPGTLLSVSPLAPREAQKVTVAPDRDDLKDPEIQSLCKTYLNRHAVSASQKKHIHRFSGDRVTVEILKVEPEDFSVLTPSCRIAVESTRPELSVSGLDDVGGLSREKRMIRERLIMPLQNPDFFALHGIRPPRGILLWGPPGCGKTLVARAVSREIKARFVEIAGNEVFRPYVGESERYIAEKFKEAREKAPSLVLIDEVDMLGRDRSETRGDLERRLVTALLTEMDGLSASRNVTVMATTNTPEAIDPALRRPGRFDYEIPIGVPDARDREDILARHTAGMALSAEAREGLSSVAERTRGFVGADLMHLCREAAFSALKRAADKGGALSDLPVAELSIFPADFDEALKTVKPSALRELAVETPAGLSWKDLGGLEKVKETLLSEVVELLKNPGAFLKVGVTPIRGLLLYGPPGTGKTLIARILAAVAGANFISVKGPEILSKWLGESERRVRELFQKAREASPAILFFDEVDAVSAVRGSSANEAGDRVVNQILTEMDGFSGGGKVLVMAATNRVELVDPAFLRPGRFDYQIEIPLPDEAGLAEIYRIHLSGKPLGPDADPARLAADSKGFSGAHAAEVCRRAALAAFREAGFTPEKTLLAEKHLAEAIKTVKKTISAVERPIVGFTGRMKPGA